MILWFVYLCLLNDCTPQVLHPYYIVSYIFSFRDVKTFLMYISILKWQSVTQTTFLWLGGGKEYFDVGV